MTVIVRLNAAVSLWRHVCVCVRECTKCAHSDAHIMGDFFLVGGCLCVADHFQRYGMVRKIIIMLKGGSCSESEI